MSLGTSNKLQNNMYFLNVNCNGITSKNHFYSKCDYEIIDELYNNYDENGYPIIYNLVHKIALNIPKSKKLVTFSPDPAVSGGTITGLAEKFTFVQGDVFPKLRIIYLTSSAHMLTNYKEITLENLANSTISNAMGHRNNSYSGHRFVMNPDQFFLLGINDNLIEDDEREILNDSGITYFTLEQIRKKGISKVIEYINGKILSDPLMVVFDMSSTSYNSCPCVTRFLKDGLKTNMTKLNGFNNTELTEIFSKINSENLVGLDITSFDFRIDEKELAYRISCEIGRIPLNLLLGIKEKKINVFNENSRFLIYRPADQESKSDVGWYILRGVPLQLREELMKHIDDDTITSISIDIDGNGKEQLILVTTTTMTEQESKSILMEDTKMMDCCLYPNEKTSMMFELLNTEENSLHAETL